jgi:hypothetical protein
MKHIKSYWSKIESAVASKSNTAPKGRGLLASSKPKDQPKTEMDVIVGFVQSIRQSREEIKNG